MADMPVLALDISDDAVAGVLFAEDKRGVTIIASHYRVRENPSDLGGALAEVVERCGGRSARCLVSFGAEQFFYRTLRLPFTDPKKVLSILPFEIQDSVSIADDQMVFDFMLETRKEEGTDVFVALVRKEQLKEWLALLLEYELDPELITISGLPAVSNRCRFQKDQPGSFVLLDVGFRRAALFLVADGQVRAVRSIPYAVNGTAAFAPPSGSEPAEAEQQEIRAAVLKRLAEEVHNTLFALKTGPQDPADFQICLGGAIGRRLEYGAMILEALDSGGNTGPWRPFADIDNLDAVLTQWPAGAVDHALALAGGIDRDRNRTVNFRKDEFAREGGDATNPRRIKMAALVLLGLFLTASLFQVFDYRTMAREQERLIEQLNSLYQETVAGARPSRDPVRELQAKVNELQGNTAMGAAHDPNLTVVNVLADISGRIPASMQVTFERFIYDRKSIRVRGLTDNFNTVDQMKKELEKSPFFRDVSIGSANIAQKEEGVRFELKLQM